MDLTDAEQRFLARRARGHLATIGPDGTPQVKPLGFSYNRELGTIDISGPRRVISFNVDPDHPGLAARDIVPGDGRDVA